MNPNHLLDLVESEEYDQLETSWLECLESGNYELDTLFQVARELGRRKQKPRALLLMGFLDEFLKEKELWRDRLRVLQDLARHTQEPGRLEEINHELQETLRLAYPTSPSLNKLLNHFQLREIRDPEQLFKTAQKIQEWLKFDVGGIFYEQGYGIGKVKEINVKLNVIRMDFQGKKDVTIELGDSEVISLNEDHMLREKFTSPEEFRRKVKDAPDEMLGRLLNDFKRPMNVAEIKNCLTGVVEPEQWSRWWTAARRNPQVITSGKGAQATYEWTDSSEVVDKSVKETFKAANLSQRIQLAKQHSRRSRELTEYFEAILREDAIQAYREGRLDAALELLDLFTRWPSAVDLGFAFEDLIRNSDPLKLLNSIENAPLKLKIFAAMKEVFPDRWAEFFAAALPQEQNSRILSQLFENLNAASPDLARQTLAHLAANPHTHPGAFTWMSELAATQPGTIAEFADETSAPKFLISVLAAIDSREFSTYRSRLKKALEGGLLTSVMEKPLERDVVQKILHAMENSDQLEDYRRDRFMNFIRSRTGESHKKDDLIFTTREAFERKRLEFENLLKVELPANRKTVGEAAALGDLKENHEYKAARERQEYLIHRVEQLQNELNQARVIEPGGADCSEVRPGTKVVLSQSAEKKMLITLLGPWDSNPQAGVYSYQAPLGTMLLGKLPGEQIRWNDENWVVEKIEPWS